MNWIGGFIAVAIVIGALALISLSMWVSVLIAEKLFNGPEVGPLIFVGFFFLVLVFAVGANI